jgi:glutamate--cysteine ligase catalytic subunit
MGLLSLGTPLPWEKASKYANKVRKDGIEQFINIYNQSKDRKGDLLYWGDEVSIFCIFLKYRP